MATRSRQFVAILLAAGSSFAGSQASAECATVVECSQEAVEAATQALAIAKILVPQGAVLAFNREECPTAWKPYVPAYGRFIRGIDKSNENIDPDGKRIPGNTQEDAFEEHDHSLPTHLAHSGDSMGQSGSGNHHGHNHSGKAGPAGSEDETRPKNVALLFCEKE